MTIIRVGVDIAKSVFHVHGVDGQGKHSWSGKYPRTKWVDQVRKKFHKTLKLLWKFARQHIIGQEFVSVHSTPLFHPIFSHSKLDSVFIS